MTKQLNNYLSVYRIFGVIEMLLALAVIVLLLTSCSPLNTATPQTPTARAAQEPANISPTDAPHVQKTCTVTGEKVYLRAGAGMNFEVIAVTHKGDVLTVRQSGEWLKVSTREHTGFIHSAFCR